MKFPMLALQAGAQAAPKGGAQEEPQKGAIGDILRQVNLLRDRLQAFAFPPWQAATGVLLQGAVVSGNNRFDHGLRRKLRGWVILRVQASTGVTIVEFSSDETSILFNSSGDATISVWVY